MGTFNRLHLIRQVDLFTLRLFLSAIEEEQIGRAAIRENIAASTATKRIQALEGVAGIQLLEREPGGVVPTPAGAVLARYVRQIFDSLDDMRSEIAFFTDGVRGELAIASARTIFVPFLARELGDFSREYPLVDLAVHDIENADIPQHIAHGEADVGVFAAMGDLDLGGVDVTPYRQDRLVALVPRDHWLSERSDVTFGDLLSEDLIAVASILPSLSVAARELNRSCEPKFTVRSAGVAMSLVRAGLGVSVQPECLVTQEVLATTAAVELAEPWAVRQILVATAHGRTLSPPADALVRQLLDHPHDDRQPMTFF
ncbi:LysR substrate-binding domain-containing protein [Streptomyces sp. NPDC005813]|uniref:LysR family transcriptional regulator n=1 Tax=Streptomyces sp. NPDC005813 TaxID=3155592 RepID=UPI0033E140A8